MYCKRSGILVRSVWFRLGPTTRSLLELRTCIDDSYNYDRNFHTQSTCVALYQCRKTGQFDPRLYVIDHLTKLVFADSVLPSFQSQMKKYCRLRKYRGKC